jgi:hypothetical protein
VVRFEPGTIVQDREGDWSVVIVATKTSVFVDAGTTIWRYRPHELVEIDIEDWEMRA